MREPHIVATCITVLSALLSGCGGGGGVSSSGGSSGGSTAALAVSTEAVLPATLQGQSYSATLTATGGKPPYVWAIAQASPTALFPDGVTVNAGTGAITGNTNWAGTAGFIATVTDSASQTASKNMYVTAYTTLRGGTTVNLTGVQYQGLSFAVVPVTGGMWPLRYALASGTLPAGVKIDAKTGLATGTPLQTGVFQWSVNVSDSFSPPQLATQPFSATVSAPQLSVNFAGPSRTSLNRPFSSALVASGGVPPYHFALTNGSMPEGISGIDPNTGQFSGTPTRLGNYFFSVSVTDTASVTRSGYVSFVVATAAGRNDSIATATALTGDGYHSASISPYGDTGGGDNDYFALTSMAGTTVHLETSAKRYRAGNPLDTVLEILDGNGVRLNACREPGDTTSSFNSPCLNDDLSASPHIQDSVLDLRVPGPANTPYTFYAHVLDWRGDARPDMTYTLQVSGVRGALQISNTGSPSFSRGQAQNYQLFTTNNTGAVTYSLTSGSLPDGLALSPVGTIGGTPTALGKWTFVVQATDSGSPAQTAAVSVTMYVIDPFTTDIPNQLPDACVNAPYTFQPSAAGGTPPYSWSVSWYPSVAISIDQHTGKIAGTPASTGTFTATLYVSDAASRSILKYPRLLVKQCP